MQCPIHVLNNLILRPVHPHSNFLVDFAPEFKHGEGNFVCAIAFKISVSDYCDFPTQQIVLEGSSFWVANAAVS